MEEEMGTGKEEREKKNSEKKNHGKAEEVNLLYLGKLLQTSTNYTVTT